MKCILLLAMSIFGIFSNSQAIDVGAAAPAISALDESGATVKLSDFYAKGPTLVYFYPKADTPGCTKQACSLRDSFESLQARGLQIVGVSEDKVASQKKFKDKYKLPFQLVADHDGAVAKAFGVPTMLGFAKRQSFLINKGKVIWRDLDVSPSDHVAKVGLALDTLKI